MTSFNSAPNPTGFSDMCWKSIYSSFCFTMLQRLQFIFSFAAFKKPIRRQIILSERKICVRVWWGNMQLVLGNNYPHTAIIGGYIWPKMYREDILRLSTIRQQWTGVSVTLMCVAASLSLIVVWWRVGNIVGWHRYGNHTVIYNPCRIQAYFKDTITTETQLTRVWGYQDTRIPGYQRVMILIC